MTLEMAKSIVDKEMANSQNYDYIQFDLFGGEPFLAFDIIKPLVESAFFVLVIHDTLLRIHNLCSAF